MTPDIVVDIGNTRIKWGWCEAGRVQRVATLGDDPAEWERVISGTASWAIASVHPARLDRFVGWVRSRDEKTLVLRHRDQIPIPVRIQSPESVGLDRLLACLAAQRLYGPGPLLVVQVGTAVVVNLVSAECEFRGGAILPGFQLMARSLATGTALLPEVAFSEHESLLPGENTEDAIQRGIYWSIRDGVLRFRSSYAGVSDSNPMKLVLTGGDARLLLAQIPNPVHHVPALTLEGIRIAAEALP